MAARTVKARPASPHHEHATRIAVLESKMDSLSASLTEIKKTQDVIVQSLNKNKGFWGGALLMISAIWAFLTQIAPHIADFFHTQSK